MNHMDAEENIPTLPPDSPNQAVEYENPSNLQMNRIVVGCIVACICLISLALYTSAKMNTVPLKNADEVKTALLPTTIPETSPTLLPTLSLKAAKTPTVQPTATKVPSPKASVTPLPAPSNTPTSVPAPTATSAPTLTPTMAPDTIPPTLNSMTGPADGGSYAAMPNFCFPAYFTDTGSNSNEIQTSFRFDDSDWSTWEANFSPCYNNVSAGVHTFSIKARDAAHNESTTVTRTFTLTE